MKKLYSDNSKWYCDPCEKYHLASTHQNTTKDGKHFCDKWKEYTDADIE